MLAIHRVAKIGAWVRLIAPVPTLLFAWGLGLILFFVGAANAKALPYFLLLVQQEGLRERYSFVAFVWLAVAILAFALGSRLGNVRRRPHQIEIPMGGAEIYVCFVLTAAIAFLWVGVAVLELGGIAQMAALAASDNQIAREKILNAAFPGGRLASSGFLGLAVMSAAKIGFLRRVGRRDGVVPLALILSASLGYLAIIPILTSGRINFFVAAIGSFVAMSLASRRVVKLRYALVGMAVLAVVWTAKEYFTLGHISEESVESQGYQSLLFYFYNDILNALNAVENIGGDYTLGWYSFRFFLFFTFTSDLVRKSAADSFSHVRDWLSAGEVPFLMASYVDFGVAGILILILIGFFCQRVYCKAMDAPEYSAIYGVCFASLLMSTHNSYLTSQEAAYNILLILFLAMVARKFDLRRRQLRSRTYKNPVYLPQLRE